MCLMRSSSKVTDSLPESNIIAVKAFYRRPDYQAIFVRLWAPYGAWKPSELLWKFPVYRYRDKLSFRIPIKPLNLAFDLLLSLSDGILIRPVG